MSDNAALVIFLAIIGAVVVTGLLIFFRGATAPDREAGKTERARLALAAEQERTAQAKIWADKARAGTVYCPNCGSVSTTKRPGAKATS